VLIGKTQNARPKPRSDVREQVNTTVLLANWECNSVKRVSSIRVARLKLIAKRMNSNRLDMEIPFFLFTTVVPKYLVNRLTPVPIDYRLRISARACAYARLVDE
jgi:hypothetical protein